MPYKPKDFYSYFKECYKLDYKEFSINNIFSQQYPHKWFVSREEELLSDNLPYIPYFNKKVSDLEKDIELYKLEKKLFYASFFVLGKNLNPLAKDKRICAPLVLFPARIVTVDEEKYLEIDRESGVVNRSVLSMLECKEASLSKDLFVQEFSELIENHSNSLLSLSALIDKYFVNLEAQELLFHPRVWSATKIRKYLSNTSFEEGEYKIVPAAGSVFVSKSESSLKVLNDLNEIISQDSFNSSLAELLNNETSEFGFNESLYKSRLNSDQASALENAYRFSNSVIVGPPGTGKTYTITSIVSDLVANNQSVLVVSKTRQAVEVLRTMLQDDFKLKDYLIHTTGNKYRISLIAKIKKYLSGMLSRNLIKLDEEDVFKHLKELQSLETKFEGLVERELQKSELNFAEELSLFEKWKKLYLNSGLFNNDKLWDVFEEIGQKRTKLDAEITTFSKRKIESNIQENSKIYRRDISLFHDALDAKSFSEFKQSLTKVNQANILKVFPIWLANLGDLNAVLPLQKDLFDVLIIDEATQCDVALALPAIFRAKRTVIVGDPNQLRHYSFVSKAQQMGLQRKFNLASDKIFDYRNRSILDLYISKVERQEQVSFLREHFRSSPSLIEFSNQKFYEGRLEVIKSTPKHTNNRQIELIDVGGRRDAKGVNQIEAEAVIAKMLEIVARHEEKGAKPSIGIISPFNSQVSYINKLLKENFELHILKSFKVLCGTPYNFQGSEREIVLLSFGVCDKTHPSAFIHANKPEVLNVAITRSKSFQYVFRSVSEEFCRKESLLFDYFRFIKSFSHSSASEPEKDEFQKEVIWELEKMNFDEIKCGYPVAGNLLDILICHKNHNYFIDLIGYPGIYREAFSLERYQTLGRTGIKCLPLHYSYWNKNRESAVQRILDFVGVDN